MLKNISKVSSLKILLIILFTFIFIELFFRAFYSEYSNRTVSEKKVLKNYYFTKDIKNFENFKIRNSKLNNKKNSNKIYIIGDSITKGFGLAYQDTFFGVAENMFEQNKNDYEFIPLSIYASRHGSEIGTLLESFKKYYSSNEEDNKKNNYLIYQFNYNDIFPNNFKNDQRPSYHNKDLTFKDKFVFWTAKFRYTYLNKSTFLAFLQSKLSNLSFQDSNKCKNYSLGPFSYSYGSKGLEKESAKEWGKFQEKLNDLKKFSKKNNFHLRVLIIPTILDFDYQGTSNPKNWNLKCSTINAHEKILSILNTLNIEFIDPTNYLKKISIKFSKEENPKNFFFDLDWNHINERSSHFIGEYIFLSLYKEIEGNN